MHEAMPSGPGHTERIIWLEAIDQPRSIDRRYSVALTRDLFGSSSAESSWGRIRTLGQSRTVSFAQGSEAERFIALLLRRRAGAPKADRGCLSRGDPAGIGPHRRWRSRATSAASPARSSTNPACSSASAACEAVRLVTPRARASSARVRGPSPKSRRQASGAREEA